MQQRQGNAVSVWAGSNPYGYRLNINHPSIKRLYAQYQREHGLDVRIPMTDAQRLAFESEIMQKLREHGINSPPRPVSENLPSV